MRTLKITSTTAALLYPPLVFFFYRAFDGEPFWYALAAAALAVVFVLLVQLPALIAVIRRHPDTIGIVILSVIFSWTLLGWVVGMVWALAGASYQKENRVDQIGDVVNGYVLRDSAKGVVWMPVDTPRQ